MTPGLSAADAVSASFIGGQQRAVGARPMSGDTPVQGRPGLQVAFLRDREGNVLELVQYDDVAAYRSDLQHPQTQPGDMP